MTFDGTRPTFATLRTDNILPTGGLPAGATGGGIIQCVQAIKTDTSFLTGNSGTVAVSGLSVNITPRSTSNKVLVIVQLGSCTNNNQPGILLYRNGSVTSFRGDAAGSRGRVAAGVHYIAVNLVTPATFTYIDSPGSTSQQTYAVYVTTDGNSSVYVNYSNTDTDSSAYLRSASSIIAMEVSA
jgi:hypothetical protein